MNLTSQRLPGGHLIFSLLLSLVVIAGCGFHLKESAQLPASFGPVSVEGVSNSSDLYRSIRNILKGSGIKIVDPDSANNRISVRITRNDRKVLSVDTGGKVSEYELLREIRFSVRNAAGTDIIEEQTISVTRYYDVNDSDAALNDSLEEADLRRIMDEELADRMFRYIAAQAR